MVNDFVASFESFLREKDPSVCLTCWGEGKLIERLPMTGLEHPVECPECHGTGKVEKEEQWIGKRQ